MLQLILIIMVIAGLWTGLKHNGFSLQRVTRQCINESIIDKMIAILDDYWPPGWLIRDTSMFKRFKARFMIS